MYMMMKMMTMTKLFVLVAFTLCCASCLYASEMPEVEKKTPSARLLSFSSSEQFWSDAKQKGLRGLGEMDPWQYTSFDGDLYDRMSQVEQQGANAVLAWIGQARQGAGLEELFEAKFYPNTVWPAVDGVKKVSSDSIAFDGANLANSSHWLQEQARLVEFACDLSWEQPNPRAAGNLFSPSKGYCATEAVLVLFNATSLGGLVDQLATKYADIINDNVYQQISCGCTIRPLRPKHYYCGCLFVAVDKQLLTNCAECCSANACATKR